VLNHQLSQSAAVDQDDLRRSPKMQFPIISIDQFAHILAPRIDFDHVEQAGSGLQYFSNLKPNFANSGDLFLF
jgi:hypothetical protein